MCRWLLALGFLYCSQINLALADDRGEEVDFPKILTLGAALEMLDASHPKITLASIDGLRVQADQMALENEDSLTAYLSAEARQVDRIAEQGHNWRDDSRLILTLNKPLYRFGQAAGQHKILRDRRAAARQRFISAASSVRLEMLQAFFDTLLADYEYLALFERMTLAYLAFDDARDNLADFGEGTEAEVRALEADYLGKFAARTVAQNKARSSRLRLALALSQPLAMPDQLVEPALDDYDRPLPEYEQVLELLTDSPIILEAKKRVEVAESALAAVSLENRPTLGARFEAAEYERKRSGTRDQFRASLYLDVPLKDKRKTASIMAQRRAELAQYEAELASLHAALRLQVLGLVQRLELLRDELAAAKVGLLAAELKLDKVRLQYEMELRARIGSANAEVAEAIFHLAAKRFDQAMTWERLDALTGKTTIEF